jgi:hypothetical protein
MMPENYDHCGIDFDTNNYPQEPEEEDLGDEADEAEDD